MKINIFFICLGIFLTLNTMSLAQSEKANSELYKASVSNAPSLVFQDSVDIVVSIGVKEMEEVAFMELRYGTREGGGELISMNLSVVKEGGDYFLLSGGEKILIKNNVAVIRASGDKTYIQEHDRYFSLRFKDKNGLELKHISQVEKH